MINLTEGLHITVMYRLYICCTSSRSTISWMNSVFTLLPGASQLLCLVGCVRHNVPWTQSGSKPLFETFKLENGAVYRAERVA